MCVSSEMREVSRDLKTNTAVLIKRRCIFTAFQHRKNIAVGEALNYEVKFNQGFMNDEL